MNAAIAVLARDGRAASQGAIRLLADGRMRQLRPGLWRVESETRGLFYLSTEDSCTCPAGQYGRICKHRLAAVVLAA